MAQVIPERLLKMPLKKKKDGWWITKVLSEYPEAGPYDTKEEALDIREGLRRFARAHPEYVTLPSEQKRLKQRKTLGALLDE